MSVSPPIGTINHKYELGDLLGVGGMGQVFAARDVDGSELAVKLLLTALTTDPGMIARLADEARAGRRVRHRNVVRAVDHGVTVEGLPYLVMERVRGASLGAIIRREGALSLSRAGSIALQILAGLAAIHRAGLVHGDLKSDNVLVDSSDGRDHVTIIDLGLARPPCTHPACDDGQVLSGTPAYMAPELIRGDEITAAADLYAVGIIIYELLTGATPFGGGNVMAVLTSQLHEAAVPPSLRRPDRTIPVSLEDAILCALEKDPAARHVDAEWFATAIEDSFSDDLDDWADELRDEQVPISDVELTHAWLRPTTLVEGRRRLARGTGTRAVASLERSGRLPRAARRTRAAFARLVSKGSGTRLAG